MSGGLIVMHEEFTHDIFKNSFRKAYIGLQENEGGIKMGTEGTINIKCSKQVCLNGLLGQYFAFPTEPLKYSALNIS
jgi:hypothetical protein